MPKNRIQTLPSSSLTDFVGRMLNGIDASPDRLGLPDWLVASLEAARAEAESGDVAVGLARNAYRARVREREAKDAACAELAATAARMLYANPMVDAAAIAGTGLQPRPTTRSRVVPQAPTGLNLALRPTGELALAWTKNNPYGVNYRVEAQVGAEPWAFVTDVTAGKVVLRGYAPGMQVAFRVRASRCGRVSEPSPVVLAWPAAPALRQAA